MLPLPINPPAIVRPEPVLSYLETVETQKQEHIARIAKEALEAAEEARKDALWAAHPSGNDYNKGQCVWHVARWTKVPAGMHSAKYWWNTAKEWGFDVGLAPKPGAVGISTRGRWGHAVLVLSVNDADGTITIREGNYNYRGSVRTRKAMASEFRYIYFD